MKETKKLLKSLLVLAIVISAVFVLTGCGSNDNSEEVEETEISAEEAYLVPLTNYFEGIKNKDVDQVLKAFPDFMDMEDSITSDDIDDLYATYESSYGANIQIDYAFGEATALEEDELAEIEEEILSIYTDLETIDITAGYTVEVTVTITGDGVTTDETEETDETTDDETDEDSTDTEETTDEESDDTEEESSDNVEESYMYVLEYEGNWYIM